MILRTEHNPMRIPWSELAPLAGTHRLRQVLDEYNVPYELIFPPLLPYFRGTSRKLSPEDWAFKGIGEVTYTLLDWRIWVVVERAPSCITLAPIEYINHHA